MFSINTNIASLEAQANLGATSLLQTNTIGQVSSGLRIVHSGDDAAGLAIANGYRSDEAVLTQGIANANNGIGQLQIIDGGMNNISQLLDTARTLATESASGTFTGDRGTLNDQFQSVLGEIDRESQAIGMNQGGQFAKALSVFVGGGQASVGGSAASAVSNGSINLNLTNATVDTKSLGLSGVQVVGGTAGTTDIGTGSANTSVSAIVSNVTNAADSTKNDGQAGYTDFIFNGPGFSSVSGDTQIKVAVNLAGVTDANTLVAAINNAISAQGSAGNQQATAFKNANIVASTETDSTGKTQLTFGSSASAFQVTAGDATSNALLGNFAAANSPVGASANPTVTGTATATPTANESVNLTINGAGLAAPQTITVALTTADTTTASLATAVQAAITANTTLAAAGITVAPDTASGTKLQFTGLAGQTFQVQAAGDLSNSLGLGSYQASATTYEGQATAAFTAGKSQGIEISVNGGATVDLGILAGGGAEGTGIAAINAAIQNTAIAGTSALRAAGVTAVDDGAGNIQLQAATGVTMRVNVYSGGAANGDAFGFGATNAGAVQTSSGSLQSTYGSATQLNAQGENQSNATANSDVFTFTGLTDLNDAQTVTLSAVDSTGDAHSLNVSLNTTNASTLDGALATINTALQNSNDTTLQGLVAFKQLNHAGTQEGIRIASANNAFSVSLGTTTNDVGLSDGGTQGATDLLKSGVYGIGGTANISNQTSAEAAVSAIGSAVTALGNAQASIGNGENGFQYAVNLAQSQLTNETAAESQIRDANLASESATLTKAQILLQAGVAALAQANSAPQQLLTLLQGH